MKKSISLWQVFLLGLVMMNCGWVKAQSPSTDTVFTIPYSYGFEDGLGNWTTIDHNNDGHTWSITTPVSSSVSAHGGTEFVGCSSWIGGVGAIHPDDYLVSPAIAVTGNAILSWYERSGHSNYYAEHYSVYISTSGNSLSDFDTTSPIFSSTLGAAAIDSWGYRQLDLSAFVGDTIHIAFRHHGCYDEWALLFDDIEVNFGQTVTIPPATVPYSSGFEPGDDTAWTFTNIASNGWCRGTAATATGNSLYISADGGATHSRTFVHGYLWATRELAFSNSGDYRIGYDWIANGYVNGNTIYEYMRVFLAPQGVGLDTSYFVGSFNNQNNINSLPAGWISLSYNGTDLYLRGETSWHHRSQTFHIDNAGTYTLVVLWANHDPYMWTGPSYAPPAAIDNITVTSFSCQSQVANLRLSATDNQGVVVEWDDPTGSQWAVYANNVLYGTTNSTSFYIADPDIAAATGSNNNPIIGVSSICANNDTSAMATISANWEGYHVQGNNIECAPFDLPYIEDFEAYDPTATDHLCWHHMGGLPKRVDTTFGHLSTRSLLVKSSGNYISHTITPKFNAPGNRLLVSFWALMPTTDTLGRLSVGLHRHYDEMMIDSVNANIIELLSVRSGQSGWQHYTFSTGNIDETGMVGVSFKLLTPTYHECYIDDLEVSLLPENQDSVPPVVSIIGQTEAHVFVDTISLESNLIQGDTAGLTYIWNSTMASNGLAQFIIQNSTFKISYSAVGNDTITLVATNPFGSDTVRHYISVYDNLQLSISGASAAFVGDTMHYSAVLEGPDTSGLSFSWHSTMADAGLAQLSTINNRLSIAYSVSGVDTITLNVSNNNGIHSARRVVNVSSACGTIGMFPYFESFENYVWQDHEACWLKCTRSGIIDNEWRRVSQYHHGGSYGMYSNGNVTGMEFDAWLIMPAIDLPNADTIDFSFYARPQYVSNFYVLVSPSGDSWYDGFTDTIYYNNWNSAYNTNNWYQVSLSLDNYRGRHIRIAFVHKGYSTLSNIVIDDVAISASTDLLPPVCDTIHTLPWFNNFATDLDCWTQQGGGIWVLNNSSSEDLRVTLNSSVSDNSTMLVSRPITLGSDTTGLRLYWKEKKGSNNATTNGRLDVSILVCEGSMFDIASCDTIYSEMANTTTTFVQRSTSLAAYAGQTVRLAFVVSRSTNSYRYMLLSEVAVYGDRVPIGTLSAPGYVSMGDTVAYSVDLEQGDSSTLACTWHSTLMDSAWVVNGADGLNEHIVYTISGLDTVSVTVANAYGAFTQSVVVNVVECDTLSTFPWVESFESNGSYNLCWLMNGFTHNNPGTSFNFTDSDGQYIVVADYLNSNGVAGSYLITPAISLPSDASDIVFLLQCTNIGNRKPLRVLVSPTAATDTALFTDTLALLNNSNNQYLCKYNLAAYAGQTIRIALIHSHTSVLRVFYVGVDYDTLPVIGTVTVPSQLSTNFSKLCTATLRYGSTTGLNYSWSSTAGGTFVTNALGDSAWVSYAVGGMTDTITVVATNLYGSDTVSKTALVVDCNPATALPWSEDFEGGLVCWQQPEVSNWITRKWTTSYMLSLLRYKGNVLCSNINQDSVYDMIVSKPITIAGTVADSIRLHWLAGTNTDLFPHSYWVMVTTDDPMSDSCNYDTLYSAVSHIFGSSNRWDTLSVSLSAYVGQTVHIAFYSHPNGMANYGSFVDLYIDDVEIRSTSAPIVTLTGPTEVNSLDTVTYTAILTEGDTNGLTFTWYSKLNGINGINGQRDLSLVYNEGGRDTVTVVVANAHGADTATLVVTVHDCVIDILPFFEDFNGTTAVSYDAANGEVPACWHRYWNGSNANYAPHVINNYYQNTNIRSYVLSNYALALLAGTDEGFDSVAMVESPYFADPIRGQILSFRYMQENSERGTLSVGYMADSGFVSVEVFEGQQAGRTVTMRLNNFPSDVHRFTLRWERSGIWYGAIVDSIQVIAADSVPDVQITAPAFTQAFDTTLLQANLTNGDTTGLTYIWSSSLLDTSWVLNGANGQSGLNVVYTALGTDTVSVVATNAYGSDTAWHTLTVTGKPGGVVSGPSSVYTDDTILFTGLMVYGVDSNVAFSWHSTMAAAGNATMIAVDDSMRIVYFVGGTDTLTLAITNILGSSTITRTVNVTGCHITTFPWSEDFESGLGNCWSTYSTLTDEWMQSWRVENYYYTAHGGSRCMMSQNLTGQYNNVADWLMMPPVEVPDSNSLALYFWVNYVGNPSSGLKVLVSTTGGSSMAAFTDTLFSESTHTITGSGASYRSTYESRSVSLAPYVGQTIWIAFVHEGPCRGLLIDDISIETSGLPLAQITGPSSVLSCDTAHFVANILQGDTAGLTYTWRSNKVDSGAAGAVTNGATFDIDYYEGGTDVITLIVTNAMGSDTVTKQCSVIDCEPVTQLPWLVSLNSTPTCWTRDGGWVVSNYFSSGITCMTVENWNYEAADSWLITREMAIPDDTTQSYSLRWHMLCDHSIFQVLVSTQGRSNHGYFTDTLYSVMTDTASWQNYDVSLDAYRGQNIHIAFHNGGWFNSPVNYSDIGVVRIDTVQILLTDDTIHVEPPVSDTVWRTVTVNAIMADGSDEPMIADMVSGAGTYIDGTIVTLEGEVHGCSLSFVFWITAEGDTIYDNPYSFVVTSDVTFTAVFAWFGGVDDVRESGASNLEVYPNPASTSVTITVSEPSTITVLDIFGRVVIPQTSVISKHNFQLSTFSLPSGVYFVRANSSKGITTKRLIVKQNINK